MLSVVQRALTARVRPSLVEVNLQIHFFAVRTISHIRTGVAVSFQLPLGCPTGQSLYIGEVGFVGGVPLATVYGVSWFTKTAIPWHLRPRCGRVRKVARPAKDRRVAAHSHYVAKHRRSGRGVAVQSAAVGAAGVVILGAAFGLTSGITDSEAPTDTRTAGTSLDPRSDRDVASRGQARVPLRPAESVLPRAAPLLASPSPSPSPSPTARPTAAVVTTPTEIPDGCDSYSGNRLIACAMLSEFGFGLEQMPPLDNLWSKESGWNHQAENLSSGAYGIPQALPGDKMAAVGDDWRTNPATQIRWGLGYIQDRYGSPQAAWEFWQANNWY